MVWCLGVLLALVGIGILGSIGEYGEYLRGEGTPREVVVHGVLEDVSLGALLVATLLYVLRARPDRRRLVRAITISTIVIMAVTAYFEIYRSMQYPTDLLGNLTPGVDPALWACRWAMVAHGLFVIIPLVIVPMRWAESAWIVAGCWIAYMLLIVLQGHAPPLMAAAYGVLAVLIALPPVAFSHWRYQRFDAQFQHQHLRGRYGEISAELVEARRLHESLFPQPITDGPVRVRFVYQPMRQIGGDFLFIHSADSAEGGGPLYVVLIDVSGHGVASALAVNRLHGELLRLFAAQRAGPGSPAPLPPISAGQIIDQLNTYVHAALAPQCVFATAICLKIDPGASAASRADESEAVVEWCNAGHPPALLRSRTGAVHRLDPTATMLGVLEPEIYNPKSRRIGIVPGETLIAYTDGLPECRDEDGRELGMSRIEELLGVDSPRASIDGPAPRLAESIAQAAAAHRGGEGVRITDDMLVVEISLSTPAVVPSSAAPITPPSPRVTAE